jgi:chromosome segregation ATPase
VYHANVSSTSSNTSSSSNVDVEILKKLMAEKAYLQEVTERKDAEIEQIYEDNADTITELERLKEAKKDVPRDYKELDFLHRQNGVMQVQLTEDSELIAEHRKMMETLFAKFGQIKGAMKENSPNPATEKQEENNHTKKLTATINQILAEVHSLSVDFQSMPNRVTVVGNQIQQRQPKQQQPKQHAVAGTASAAAGWMVG